MGINATAVALALLVASSPSEPLRPTAKDIQEAITAQSYDPYAEGRILTWRQDLSALLRRGTVDAASATLAAKYGFPAADMRRLILAWVIAQSRQYDSDHAWVPAVRAELHALAPLVRREPLGLAIIAEALDATTEECSADDFNTLIAGSADPAADGYVIATTASCTGNFARAAIAGGPRATPALIRAAEYGGLPPRDALPLYAWLTSPAALTHVRESDRFAVAAMLWQRYLTALFDADLPDRALAAFDALPNDLRGAVISPSARRRQVAVVDGITMTFAAEDNSETMTVMVDALDGQAAALVQGPAKSSASLPPKASGPEPRDLSSIDAPILQLAEAMAIAGREEDARRLLATLPGLAEAKASAACHFAGTQAAKSPCVDARHLPMGALPLDHLLNEPSTDPYPIAETTLSGSGNFGRGASGAVLCRVFPKADYGDLCPQGTDDAYLGQTSTTPEELAVGEAALKQLIPHFPALRASVLGPHAEPAAAADQDPSARPTVIAVPPDFNEKPIPTEFGEAATPTSLKGLAPLPQGFALVRAERADQRVVAISVSQTYDPTGEVSQGGYWVHLSDDGGRHWDRPLYTGLADRFPYVVEPTSRLPLIADDTLLLAVNVSEIDTASITYPPVVLRSRRRAKNRYLTIPLAVLRQDSDGDGLTDLAAHHLLLDRPQTRKSAPFVVGSDYGADCRVPPSSEKLARIELLGRMTGASGVAIVEPVDRPAGEIMTGLRGAVAADQPLFLIGDRQDYACLTPRRMIIVYNKADLEAMKQFTPDFHALDIPHIVFNRAHDRGFVRWSTGWAGGTYRLRRVEGKWLFDAISSWIT